MPYEFKDPTPPEHRHHGPDKKRHDYCGDRSDFMSAMRIQNIPQLRNYVKLQLGSPVICIELSDDQINAVIADCIQYIWRYYFKQGHYQDYLVMDLQPGKTKYKLCQELESVADIQTTNWMGSINELFTVPHNMLYDQVMSMGRTWQGQCWGNNPAYGDMMGNWTASMVWLEEVKNTFGEMFHCTYNEKEHLLEVTPAPRRPTTALLRVYKRQKIEQVFNDIMFKRMVVAKCGMLWTNALRKYNLSIAGGGSLNADSLYSSYKDEYDAVIQRIDDESPNGMAIMIG